MSMPMRRFPKGHDYSPSAVKTYRMCPRRLYFRKVLKLPDPSGQVAQIGTIYHAIKEKAALARIDADGNFPDVAPASELMSYHAELTRTEGPWITEQVRKKLEAEGDADFENIYEAEQPIVFSTGKWKCGGILDRIDVHQGEDGLVYVRLTDYKTGFVPSYDEFLENPQTVLYAYWGWQHFSKLYDPKVLVLQIAFFWPTTSFPLEATWVDGWLVAGERRLEVAVELKQIEHEVSDYKSWTKEGEPQGEAKAGSSHCSHCPYSGQCVEYQERIKKPAQVHPWRHLIEEAKQKDEAAHLEASFGGRTEFVPNRHLKDAVGDLLAWRYQWAADAKILDQARKDVDRFLIQSKHVVTRGNGARFNDGAHEAYVRQDSTSSYPISVVEHLARSSGVPLEEVIGTLCSVSNTKIAAFVKKHPKAEGVANAYKTMGMKSPWIQVKAIGGMF